MVENILYTFFIKSRLKIEFYIKNTENSTGAVKNINLYIKNKFFKSCSK